MRLQHDAALEDLDLGGLLSRSAHASTPAARLATFLGGEGGARTAFAGLTIADLLYDALRVDPAVIQAAEMVRAADLGDLPAFALYADELLALAPSSFEGSIHQLKGYVAERFVAQRVQASGMEVEFPASATNPGFDLLVNGEPFQVKCVSSPGPVLEHLERYPEIPVFVNEEIAGRVTDLPQVYPITGLSVDGVEQATRDRIDAAADMLDLELPTVATAVALGRNAVSVLSGATDIRHGLLSASSDVVGGFLGGKAGAIGFAALGGLLGPYGVVVGGLAGAIAGSSGGRHVARRVRMALGNRKEQSAVSEAIAQLAKAALDASARGESIFRRKATELRGIVAGSSLAAYVEPRLQREERELRRNQQALVQYATPTDRAKAGADALLPLVRRIVQSKVHPHAVRAELSTAIAACEALQRRRRMLR